MLLAPGTCAGNFQLYIACLALVSAQLRTYIVVGLTGITRDEGIRLLLFKCLSLTEIEKNETCLVYRLVI